MNDQTSNGAKVFSPPVVVYGLLSTGRPLEMTPIEQLTFMASVIMARHHFSNAYVVCDSAWADYLHKLGMSHFFDEKIVVTVPVDATAAVFWSTRAKLEALKWAFNNFEGSRSVLHLDADAIIWNADLIEWNNSNQLFVGGYREPLCWEAYKEQEQRLGKLFSETCDAVGLHLPDFTEEPINGSCFFFNSAEILETYINFLTIFMEKFVEGGYEGRGFLINRNDPNSGSVMFSEVMMADQRALGVIVDQIAVRQDNRCEEAVEFFTEFDPEQEYPRTCGAFLHLWKYKGVLNTNPALAAMMEQHILGTLRDALLGHTSLLDELGCVILERSLEMTGSTYYKWIRI